MAIDSLRDGFVRLCFDPSANIVDDTCRMVIEGQYDSTADATADVLRKVTAQRDIDDLFGAGSVLAEGLKVAMDCCADGSVEFYALPREDAESATKAAYTVTVANDATSAGRVDIYWGESRWNISVRVSEGDTADEIAAAIAAAIPTTFPFSASVTDAVITLTAKNGGTVGNNLNPEVNWHGRNDYMPGGTTVTFAQTVTGATDPAPLNYDAVLGECCVCCWAVLIGDADYQDGVIAQLEDAWSCEKPQCFGHAYTYNVGSLGTVLASDTNSAVMSRLALCATTPILPWLQVAAYAAKSCCLTQDNPELSIQGPNYGVLDCVMAPESCTQCWTFAEREQLDAGGFVVTVPTTNGGGALTSPQIVNDITNNRYDEEGRENLTFRSVSARRLATATATQVAEQLQQFQGLGYFSENTNIRQGVLGTNKKVMLSTMRAWAKSQVGVLFSEFQDIDSELRISDDFELAARCQGVPGKLYFDMVYRPPVRISQVVVNAKPVLLNNC